VKFVAHMDIPDSLEAYFQEAGRAGRDGSEAYAMLIYPKNDITNLRKRLTNSFPKLDYIKDIYDALGNYFQVPIGSSKGRVFDFELSEFCKRYKLQISQAFNALGILELSGYVSLGEAYEKKAKIKILVNRDDLYRFQVDNHQFEGFLKLLLRTYTGVFTDYVKIDEHYLAKIGNTTVDTIKKYLVALAKIQVLTYIPRKQSPILVYNEERLDRKALRITKEVYVDRKKIKEEKVDSIISYINNHSECRTSVLVKYFGENSNLKCGKCDVCKKQESLSEEKIIELIGTKETISVDDLSQHLPMEEEKSIQLIRKMIDSGKLSLKQGGILELKRQKGG